MQVVATYFLLVVGFLLVAGKLFNSLRNMEVQMGVGVVLTRNESPVLFWSVIAIQCVAVGIYLALTYWLLFVLPNERMS